MNFLIDLNEGGGAMCRLDVGRQLFSAHRAATTDQLFVGDETGFSEFAVGETTLPFEWHSGQKTYPKPVNFAKGVVDAVGVATLTVYEGENVRATVSVAGRTFTGYGPSEPAGTSSVCIVTHSAPHAVLLIFRLCRDEFSKDRARRQACLQFCKKSAKISE